MRQERRDGWTESGRRERLLSRFVKKSGRQLIPPEGYAMLETVIWVLTWLTTGSQFYIKADDNKWKSPRLDGLAPRPQCGFSGAAFLRTSRGCLAVTVLQAFAVEQVSQKALSKIC